MDIFSELNPEQRQAVESLSGPFLILAGAGSGKTKVVTYRIVNLLNSGVPARAILGLTFTNKAANEMKERVQHLTQSAVLICTFHSLGARILRESIDALGYQPRFTIYDEEDSEKILRLCLSELNVPDKKGGDLKAFRSLISKAKNHMQLPEEVDTHDSSTQVQALFPKVYALYQTKLKECNALDFDDLLFLTVRLFREHPHILEMYQNRWHFLLIDEYQDTNAAQYEMVRHLVDKSHNLFVVGDPDQSIYSWRGADIHNILHFEKDHPGAQVVRLEQNYRSRSNILDAANALILHNSERYEKNLWSNKGPGSKIKLFVGYDDREEARFVARQIRQHYEDDRVPLKEIVVFYRTNAQSRAFEDQLLSQHIPYVIYGGISFYQRREIKDILAFMRMVQSGADFVSFARTINIPKRGVGEASLDKIRSGAALEGLPIFDYCWRLITGNVSSAGPKLSAKVVEALKDYVGIILRLRDAAEKSSLEGLVKAAIEYTGYIGYLKEDPETAEERKENLDELITKAVEWGEGAESPTLEAFLEELSLKAATDDSEPDRDRVRLMTLHNGKGLEFTTTFLVGMEEDLLPHINSKGNPAALEEERRLCYVGMTRAKEHLYLTCAETRYMWGALKMQRPSRFLKEIPKEYLERVKAAFPLYR
jgi:DNA helicase-2/ATP-dependent DNA helicase PcrA